MQILARTPSHGFHITRMQRVIQQGHMHVHEQHDELTLLLMVIVNRDSVYTAMATEISAKINLYRQHQR